MQFRLVLYCIRPPPIPFSVLCLSVHVSDGRPYRVHFNKRKRLPPPHLPSSHKIRGRPDLEVRLHGAVQAISEVTFAYPQSDRQQIRALVVGNRPVSVPKRFVGIAFDLFMLYYHCNL